MNIKRIISKMDHNSNNMSGALGVSNHETLCGAVYDWFVKHNSASRVIEIILTHETLNDSEKIYCIIQMGKILVINNISGETSL